MARTFRRALEGIGLLAVLWAAHPVGGQQPAAEDPAMAVLNAGRTAYNEGKHDLAAERFREFLRLYPAHKEAVSAHYGLALALVEGPQKDCAGAIQSLQQVVGRADFADRAFALYYLGVAQRELGNQALAAAAAKPDEAAQQQQAAAQQFAEAGKNFAAAAAEFAARVKTAATTREALPAGLEWAARARCDECEMLLRAGKFPEAVKLAETILSDAALGRSRYRPLALYHLGYAQYALKDYLLAGRALSQLAPFQQPFGPHARYLLARTHHQAQERPEAAAQYQGVLSGYEQQKKQAQEALKNPAALSPSQRQAMEALVKAPAPEYVLRAAFYGAVLQAEQGRFAEALAALSALVQQHPKSSLVPEAQLRQGYCQMQLRNYAEAIKVLQPLASHPELADQAQWWLARSQVAGADPANASAYQQALAGAMGNFTAAANRAGELGKTDPQAKVRRGDILMELGDTQQLAGQHKEAAATYQTALTENNNPQRAEEALQRLATALHLAGQYKESDDACARFEKTFPKSTLLPAVWFRSAENAYLTALATAEDAKLPDRAEQARRLFEQAIARYRRLIEGYPEFPHVNVARLGLGSACYRLGRYDQAIESLSGIPEADRIGSLSAVPYLLADCMIRTLPLEAEDAVQAAGLVQQAQQAAKLLEGFASANPKAAETPDALVKLAHCYQRMAEVTADAAERQKLLGQARTACEQVIQQFAKNPAMPTAVFERGKCLALLGDAGGAVNELGRFRSDPLRNAPVAPLALVRLSRLLRGQNKSAEAAAALAQFRASHEANLLKDPARSDWAAMLQYEHAVAVQESGKTAEARAIFEALAKQFPARPEGLNALWRVGQCRREELSAAMSGARKVLAKADAKPDEIAAAEGTIAEAGAGLHQVVEPLQALAHELGRTQRGSLPHLRALYESAWCYRVLAEGEIDVARRRLQREALEAVRAKLTDRLPAGQAPPVLSPPEVPLSAVSVRLAERAAQEQYERLIAAGEASRPEPALVFQARLELGEMLAARNNLDAAAACLSEAVEKGPPAELAGQIRLRLAACLLAKNEPKAALAHAQAVPAKPGSPLAAHARYLVGEAYFAQGEWTKAAEQFVAFRDAAPFQNVPELSDRALLRLGSAYAQAGQWDPSRQTLQVLLQRFPNSPWADQALYGVGWSLQSQKQYDPAVDAYAQVTRRTAGEVAARAQLQIGLCRLEQKRYGDAVQAFQVVPVTYDYPEHSAAALWHAGCACADSKQPAEAAKLWKQLVRDYPAGRWAQLARQRLGQLEQP